VDVPRGGCVRTAVETYNVLDCEITAAHWSSAILGTVRASGVQSRPRRDGWWHPRHPL